MWPIWVAFTINLSYYLVNRFSTSKLIKVTWLTTGFMANIGIFCITLTLRYYEILSFIAWIISFYLFLYTFFQSVEHVLVQMSRIIKTIEDNRQIARMIQVHYAVSNYNMSVSRAERIIEGHGFFNDLPLLEQLRWCSDERERKERINRWLDEVDSPITF